MGMDPSLPTSASRKVHNRSNVASGSNISIKRLLEAIPVALKAAPQLSGADFSVEVSRDDVTDNFGNAIPEVDYEFFKLNILPPLHPFIDIDTIISDLEDDEFIVNGRWAAFPRDPWTYAIDSSGLQRKKENEVFAPLTTIIREITSSRRATVSARRALDYESSSDSVPVCCFDKKDAMPDGYFVFNTPNQPAMRLDGRPYWRDLATPAEFKLRDRKEDLQGDISKICRDMHQIMREDPRRRFVFGFTIENTRMRIWMASRSQVVVSRPFNFITDHKKFLHFFLSQTYAPAHELGADPTMTLVKASATGECVYDITVHDVKGKGKAGLPVPIVFRTAGLINDHGTNSLLGRGTRIWRVRRLVDGKPDATSPGRVLKDSWVDEDREREGDILQQITGQPDISDTVRKALVALFLTPIACGDVLVKGRPDGTRSLITRGAHVPDTGMFSLKAFGHIPSHTQCTTSSIVPTPGYQQRNIANHFKKQHYRIVFAEECEPLSQKTSLRDVFTSLLRMTNGLFVLHQSGSGWVHRDLSSGNILYDRESDRWMLSDVEYARRLDAKVPHEMRTGTANFMAVEVDSGRYLYGAYTKRENNDEEQKKAVQPSVEDIAAEIIKPLRDDGPFSSEDRGHELVHQYTEPVTNSGQIFLYNPTHDLESLWWIAVYFVVNRETSLVVPASSRDGPAPMKSYQRDITHPDPKHGVTQQEESTQEVMAEQLLHLNSNNEASVVHNLDDTQREYVRSLFYDKSARALAIGRIAATPLDEHMEKLPAHLRAIGRQLIKLRQDLRMHYDTIESPGYEIDKMVCSKTRLYSAFRDAFISTLKILKPLDIITSPLLPEPDTGVLPLQVTVDEKPDHATSASLVNDGSKRKICGEGPSSPAPKRQKHEPEDPTDASRKGAVP
ncbi:hypothetical protein BDY19DRAFT_990038 [Irpex rosettiformis]|uniref:Uncharacterized protein n=1 Tax=Irpex rosettiformis TaxID=378272 RepID=A0ACB8UGI2_9APHY|nr:hypothetical protein BDY19DRAFT_990038 [Irpex rosettiformis]